MTYLDLIRDADRKLDTGEITLGEYEEMIEPLKREIQPERKPGRWKEHIFEGIMGGRPRALMCNQCNSLSLHATNFCPNCGADMRPQKGVTDV